jgi:DNA polymerase III epsilon subunit family exonuclease
MFDFESQRPFDIPITIIDTETTGLFPSMGHRVVELAAVRLENGQIVGEMDRLLNPQRKMDASASRVNNIYDADLVGQPTFLEVAEELLALTDGALLVAHNAAFDASFLAMEFHIGRFHGHAVNFPTNPLPNPWLCTLQLARNYFYFGRNNLTDLARTLGVRVQNAHRALSDVYTTSAILQRMVHRLDKKRGGTIGDLLMAQGSPIYATPPPDVDLPAPIAEAMGNGRQLRILYQGPHGDSDRLITPLYPTEHKGQPYLVAHCHKRRDQRTFRLDRVLSAKVIG